MKYLNLIAAGSLLVSGLLQKPTAVANAEQTRGDDHAAAQQASHAQDSSKATESVGRKKKPGEGGGPILLRRMASS
jgi:hypothetical protein